MDVLKRMQSTIAERELATPETPVLLMVSGGSDSTALAYLAAELHQCGELGPLALLHVNHQLRGQDANDDALFVSQLAEQLGIPFFLCEVDVAAAAAERGQNTEAVARHERYLAARQALESLCRHAATPLKEGRIFTAHTQDDRAESFYMRSIVGTGPGGFRAMRYLNGQVARPLLDASREQLRAYLHARQASGEPMTADAAGALWREDATNAHTDRFRAFVRHEIMPLAKERNPQLLDTLCRTMNLIADEDDYLEGAARSLESEQVEWLDGEDRGAGCLLLQAFGKAPTVLQRRACFHVLQQLLPADARIEATSVSAVLDAFSEGGSPRSGYATNIQGNLAISANKRGVRIEPMEAYRTRRKRK